MSTGVSSLAKRQLEKAIGRAREAVELVAVLAELGVPEYVGRLMSINVELTNLLIVLDELEANAVAYRDPDERA